MPSIFQDLAKREGNKTPGLETVPMQTAATFKQLPFTHIGAYIRNDLAAAHQLMYAETYKSEEMKPLPDDHNNYWLQQLTKPMDRQSLFVAVDALLLVG